jgi:glycosyltransferase involved in cell wall biosynthesis
MKIAFDHQAFCLQKAGGISRYFCKLIEQLQTMGEHAEVFAPVYRNQYLSSLPGNAVHGVKLSDYPPKMAGLSVALNGILAGTQIGKFQPDIIHETYFSKKGVGSSTCPRVLTVFDMIGELALDGVSLSQAQLRTSKKYQAVQRADRIICISHATQVDLVRIFDVSPDKICVIHLGCDQSALSVGKTRVTETHSRPFLLFVGMRQGYKNFNPFLQAIASAPRLIRDFDVVAFGGGAFSADEMVFIQSLGFDHSQVSQISGDDERLANCYRNASALVYPSLYEGFGLPPLEAMQHNCPVVCSKTSSIPEVVGEAGEYFDPTETSDIATAIQTVVYSPERTQALVELGLKQVARFTWQNCADKHQRIYQELSSDHGRNLGISRSIK